MSEHDKSGQRVDAHDFLVTAVDTPERTEDGLAVTLTDARGGRVTLHLDAVCAAALRDALDKGLA
ncbi:MAG: hypothetical protein DI629_01215 [Mesorhizobium amorphae]|nr:MAG: hypothetical protein DI629_01215 [Mesorhizobium amorphae]